MDCRVGMDARFDHRDRFAFRAKHVRYRAAIALAGDDDDTTLAVLVLGKPAIDPVFFPVGGLEVTAEIRAINLDLASEFVGGLLFGSDGLADFVRHDVSRLVLAIQVAGELQRAMALRAVGEDGDGEQIRPDRQLAAGEDRPGRDRELMIAALALEQAARLVAVNGDAAAARAIWLAAVIRPTDLLEAIVRFLVRKPSNPSEAQAPCGFGEEEVLRHIRANDFR